MLPSQREPFDPFDGLRASSAQDERLRVREKSR